MTRALIRDQDLAPYITGWVADRIEMSTGRNFGNCATLAVADVDEKTASGAIIAGIVFHNWAPLSEVIEMTVAADNPRWLTRRLVHEILAYPFDMVGCQMVVTRSDPNTTAAHMMRKLGAVQYEIPRLRGRDEPELISCLYDDVFRAGKYGADPNGQKERQNSAAT